jgi:hypothetical protein
VKPQTDKKAKDIIGNLFEKYINGNMNVKMFSLRNNKINAN